MAGRGPARRPSGAVADRRNGKQDATVVVRPDGTLAKPPAPRGLSAAIRKQYDELWASDVAVLLQPSDLAAIRRLFQLRQEREDCHAVVASRVITRVPLAEALKTGLTGTLVHELDDDGQTHTFVEYEHTGRVGLGSTGQLALSPWARDLRSIDSEIRQLEDRFGLNVRARAALAVAVRTPPPPAPPPRASVSVSGDRDLLDL